MEDILNAEDGTLAVETSESSKETVDTEIVEEVPQQTLQHLDPPLEIQLQYAQEEVEILKQHIKGVIEKKVEKLPPEIADLMPSNLSEAQQVTWLEKAEKLVPVEEAKPEPTQIGSYIQQLAREQAAEAEKALTVTEQIEKHFKALKTKY